MNREGILVRTVTVEDVPEIVCLRRRMFESMGITSVERLDAADAACESYFTQAIEEGQYRGWLATTAAGEAVSGAGLVVDQHPPGPGNLSGRVGYIMNLYTTPAYRRRGLAREILSRLVEWSRAEGITVGALHATGVGRPLYKQFGFADSNEMKARW
jgi:GNAT superfamily N-acetyltransferase